MSKRNTENARWMSPREMFSSSWPGPHTSCQPGCATSFLWTCLTLHSPWLKCPSGRSFLSTTMHLSDIAVDAMTLVEWVGTAVSNTKLCQRFG